MASVAPPRRCQQWLPWSVLFMGYIGAGRVGDDYKQGANWSVPVRPIDMYLENADAPARRYGRSNLSLGESVTTSTPLADASLIGHSGEVVGFPQVGRGERHRRKPLHGLLFPAPAVPERGQRCDDGYLYWGGGLGAGGNGTTGSIW